MAYIINPPWAAFDRSNAADTLSFSHWADVTGRRTEGPANVAARTARYCGFPKSKPLLAQP